MRAAISLEKLKSPADGDIAFVWDPEPPPALMDRHQPNLAGVKVKIQPYQSSMGQYGNSRAVSRASSRIASRFGGGSMMTSSTAFRKSVLAAVTMSKMSLSVSQSRPFDVPSWQSKAFSRNEADGSSGMQLSESAASSARYSLRTSSRTPADYAEVFRRQEVSQEIDRRESRIKQTQEIQRKSELKLKLRSLADPTISVEREEIMTSEAMQTEGRGRSRMASRGMTPALPLKKLSPLTKTSVQSSSPIAGPTETTITFRTEDYEGLDSHVVMLEKNGELLVGENCYVIAKKNRAELQHDLVHKSLVAPRFLLTSPHELAEEDPAKDHTNAPPSEHIRSPSRHAKGTRKTSVIQVRLRSVPLHRQRLSAPNCCSTGQNPMFEGQSGSFQSFPKLDLDPSKTKLAKGVVLNRSATPNTRLYQAKNATAKTTAPVSVQKPASLAQIQEDATNQHLDESMSSLVQDAQRKHSNQSRKILEPVNAPSSATVQSSRYHKEIMGSFLPTHLVRYSLALFAICRSLILGHLFLSRETTTSILSRCGYELQPFKIGHLGKHHSGDRPNLITSTILTEGCSRFNR